MQWRSCADVWGKCIAAILSQDMPRLRAVSPRGYIRKTNYREQEFRPSLETFTKQRADLLAVLQPLAHEGWSRKAIVMGGGRALEQTTLVYATKLAAHERTHLKQFRRIADTIRQK